MILMAAGSPWGRWGALLGVALILGGGAWFFEARKAANLKREAYGASGARIEALRAQIGEGPCAVAKVRALSTLLESAHQEAEAVTVLDDFQARCARDLRLVAWSARLHLGLGHDGVALGKAALLIRRRSRWSVGYALRGEVRLRWGLYKEAESDLRRAIALDMGAVRPAEVLAGRLERRGDVCGAADVLDDLLAHGEPEGASGLVGRARALRREGRCPRETVSGDEATVPFVRRGDVMRVSVVINDDPRPVTMILDTGASSVALTRALARRLNLDLSGAVPVWVTTAGGVAQAFRTRLRSVQLGGARVSHVSAAVVDSMTLDGEAEGLLGNSFLSHFHVSVDSERSQIVLSEPR